MKKMLLLLSFLAILTACTNPFAGKPSKSAQITVQISGAGSTANSRTITSDLSGLVDSYTITLTSKETPAYTEKHVVIGNALSSYTFPLVEIGIWDITVEAKIGTVILARGTLLNQKLTVDGLSAVVALIPADGNGSFSFTMEFPSTVGATSVSCALVKTVAGVEATVSGAETLTLSGSTTITATYTKPTIPSGSYSIITTFLSGTEELGVFREALTIYPNTESNKWVSTDGTTILLKDKRLFALEDFGSINTSLSGFAIQGLNLEQLGFTSDLKTYNFYDLPEENLIFTPTESVKGQKITYSWNGTEYGVIVSGSASNPLPLTEGENTLKVKVQSSNRSLTTAEYVFTFQQTLFYTSESFVPMQMVKIPGGTFQRDGSPTNTTYVSSFYMGKYEVTQFQYIQFGASNTSANQGDPMLPVENITWYDALDFCNKLSAAEKLESVYTLTNVTLDGGHYTNATVSADFTKNGYRLPTEAEWEWAAMGGFKDSRSTLVGSTNTGGYTKGYAGSIESATDQNNVAKYAWYYQNSGSVTHPVGQKLPNELGLYDMSGNVFERCWDLNPSDTSPNPYSEIPLVNPLGEEGSYNIRRGGNCGLNGWNGVLLALSERPNVLAPGTFLNDTGFRVARGVFPSRNGLIGEWLFNTEADTSKPNSDAVISMHAPSLNDILPKVQGHETAPDSAYVFTTNDSITIPADPVNFTEASSFTISVWFNASNVQDPYPYIVSKIGVPAEFNYFIGLDNGSVYAAVGVNNAGAVNVTAPVNANTWYHVLMTYDGSKVRMYLNGKYIGEKENTYHSATSASTKLCFGGGGWNTNLFSGSIDNVRVYNRVLNYAEIQALYVE